LLFDPAAGGEEPNIDMWIDLDRAHPEAQTISSNGRPNEDYFSKKTIVLGYNESKAIEVSSSTHRHYCEYRLQLVLNVGGKSVTRVIDDNGRPFRVSGMVMDESTAYPRFAYYKAVYLGGVARGGKPEGVELGRWTRIDPRIYKP
jgi:hypothetical protein